MLSKRSLGTQHEVHDTGLLNTSWLLLSFSKIKGRVISLKIVPQPLFPSLVWTTLFEDRASFNVKMLNLANQMRTSDPVGVAKTNVNGWQSPNILQNMDEFKDMNLRIVQVCQRIGESQNFKSNVIYQHQAWVNVSPPGASNKIHFHANCHFSGVYYVSLQAAKCGSIFFRDREWRPECSATRPTSQLISLPTRCVCHRKRDVCTSSQAGWSTELKST